MTIFVSRHGMTECPSCQAHIRVAKDIVQTACPFCNSSLVEAVQRTSSRSMGLGRSSVLAGALLGLSVMPACDGDDPQPQPLYGAPADVIQQDAVQQDGSADAISSPDQLPQPLYGAPAPDAFVDNGPDAGADESPQPMYGLPADIQIDTAPAPDAGPSPEYGIPPEE